MLHSSRWDVVLVAGVCLLLCICAGVECASTACPAAAYILTRSPFLMAVGLSASGLKWPTML